MKQFVLKNVPDDEFGCIRVIEDLMQVDSCPLAIVSDAGQRAFTDKARANRYHDCVKLRAQQFLQQAILVEGQKTQWDALNFCTSRYEGRVG